MTPSKACSVIGLLTKIVPSSEYIFTSLLDVGFTLFEGFAALLAANVLDEGRLLRVKSSCV